MAKKTEFSFDVSILIKKEDDLFVAHCLELDVVATSSTLKEVQEDIVSLVSAQIDYAFSNDNLDNLYHPAPPEIWKELWACEEQVEKKYPLKSAFHAILPPWLIAKTCQFNTTAHA